MKTRYEEKGKILDIAISAIAALLSVGTSFYGVIYFGLGDVYARMGLIENLLYMLCLAMTWMYFFNIKITTEQFNYWSTTCVGISVLLRDILFPTPLENEYIRLAILTLSVLLINMLTFFYARKDWEKYTKRDLWMICIIDALIAGLYNIEIYLEPQNEYTNFFLTAIWIRPTITYGLVACFILGGKENSNISSQQTSNK